MSAGLTDLQRRALDDGRRPAPPAPKGNGRALQHGCHSPLKLQPRAQEIADGLRPLVPGFDARHETLLELLALNLARIERAEEWLTEHDYWDGRGKPRPPLALLSTWQAEARRQLASLGMDNASGGSAGPTVDLAALLAHFTAQRSSVAEGSVDEEAASYA